MNIELLQGTLEISDSPGLSPIDPRFSDIATLVQEAHYEEAATQAQAIIEEQIYDVRIIGYFLYGHFIENGVGAMTDVYQSLADLLRDNLDALGPAKKREKHTQTILNWLMKQLLKKMQYEENKKSDVWDGWLAGVSSDDIDRALEAGDALRRALGPVLEDLAGPVLDGLIKVKDWLTTFQQLVYREPEPEPEPEPEEEEAAWEEEDPTETPEENDRSRGQLSGDMFAPISAGTDDNVAVTGSYHLQQLIRKLQAFDRLITDRNFPLAAIVADDINGIIANFDPKLYFPAIFSKFSLQLAMHINELVTFDPYKSGVTWQALEELYKVDLNGFVNFNVEGIDLEAASPNESYESPDGYGEMPAEGPSPEEPSYDDEEPEADDDW